MLGRIESGIRDARLEGNFFDVLQTERLSGEIHIIPDVWRLTYQFVWTNDEGRHVSWCENARNQIRQGRYCESDADIADASRPDVGCG